MPSSMAIRQMEKIGAYCGSVLYYLSATFGPKPEHRIEARHSKGYIVAIYWWIFMRFLPF